MSNKTVNEQIETSKAQFRALSASRRNALARKAQQYISDKPGCADNSGFWRSLSPRQVLAAR
jgi:hypothetical protein